MCIPGLRETLGMVCAGGVSMASARVSLLKMVSKQTGLAGLQLCRLAPPVCGEAMLGCVCEWGALLGFGFLNGPTHPDWGMWLCPGWACKGRPVGAQAENRAYCNSCEISFNGSCYLEMHIFVHNLAAIIQISCTQFYLKRQKKKGRINC